MTALLTLKKVDPTMAGWYRDPFSVFEDVFSVPPSFFGLRKRGVDLEEELDKVVERALQGSRPDLSRKL